MATGRIRDERELWRRYKARGDQEAKNTLLTSYLSLVKYVAARMAINLPPSIDQDDLESHGVLGLLDALEKFDPDRGVKFETYAVARIRGAILDGLRSWDWAPQTLRKKAREIERAYQEVEGRLGRAATDEEVAAELGITVQELAEILDDLNRSSVLSLDDVIFPEADAGMLRVHNVADESSPDPETWAYWQDRKAVLIEAISKLPEKERLVVNLYYYEGLTPKEIAMVMNLSPSRISQLHQKAILRMRGRLGRMKERLL